MPEAKRAPIADQPAQTDRPTLERETEGLRIEIEMPTSKGELAEAPKVEERFEEAPRAERPRTAPPRSRRATREEAARGLADVDLDAETTARVGEAMGNAIRAAGEAGIRDEVDDAAAARIAGAPVQDRVFLEARRAEQIGQRHDDNDHADFGPDEAPVPPTTLPAVIQMLPAFVDDEIPWLTLAQTPGYLQNAIRALGRSTFRIFPCFLDHERKARAQGCADPMSEITLLANFQGQNGPSRRQDLDRMAQWIAENGNRVEADELEFPGAFPGYHPEIVLLTTEEESFLMVRDTRANGAPIEGIYVYRWNGGAASYRLQDGRVHLGRLDAGPAARQIAGPRDQGRPAPRAGIENRQPAPPPRAVAPLRADIARIARNDPAELARQAEILGAAPPADNFLTVRRRGVRRDLPTARDATAAIADATGVRRLREAGFAPYNTVEGPGLRMETADGRTVHLMAQPGSRLIDTPTFRMSVTSGGEAVRTDEASVDQVLAEIAPAAPRP